MKSSLFKATLLAVALFLVALSIAACSATNESTSTNGNTTNLAAASPSPSASMSNTSGEMGNMSRGGMMKSSPGAASGPYDLQFIDTMIEHHQAAVDMGKMAEIQAQHAELKGLAKSIIGDQQKEIAEMKSWRDEWYAAKPQAMNMEMPGMMNSMMGMDMKKMNAASGNAFDIMFIDMMTPHHAGAVTMAKDALTKAEHPQIKTLAQQIIAAQQKEIEQMSKWRVAWASAK